MKDDFINQETEASRLWNQILKSDELILLLYSKINNQNIQNSVVKL